MIPIEALNLALAKEIEAEQLYEKLSADCPAAKDTFLFLAAEEQKHKKLIEDKLYELRK